MLHSIYLNAHWKGAKFRFVQEHDDEWGSKVESLNLNLMTINNGRQYLQIFFLILFAEKWKHFIQTVSSGKLSPGDNLNEMLNHVFCEKYHWILIIWLLNSLHSVIWKVKCTWEGIHNWLLFNFSFTRRNSWNKLNEVIYMQNTTVFALITKHTPISTQSYNFLVFRLQPVYFYLLYNSRCCWYAFELPLLVVAIQMRTKQHMLL